MSTYALNCTYTNRRIHVQRHGCMDTHIDNDQDIVVPGYLMGCFEETPGSSKLPEVAIDPSAMKMSP